MVVTAAMIGAGQRGFHVFGEHARAHPEDIEFTAVVDPSPGRRQRFVAAHPKARAFADVESWIGAERLADAAIIASPDRHHHKATVAALRAGYDVLLEKPMAATLADSVDLAREADAAGRILAVAHVLRYTPFFRTLHDVISSGRIGDIVTVEHRENVSAFHMAHSFVRGNWSRAATATPMIVQKCSHDFDILCWNLPSPVVRLASMGSLLHFRPDNAPRGAAPRCTAPCPVERCPYDARRYLNPAWTGWPVHVITEDLSQQARRDALESGRWGRCVYTAGSDVVDHQVVTMELESGTSVVLVMHGHSADETRTMRYDGTRATLRARFGSDSAIEVTDHATGVTAQIPIESVAGGHGGGDDGVLEAFLAAVRWGASLMTTGRDSLESHVLAFAAEEARAGGQVLDVSEFRRTALSPLG